LLFFTNCIALREKSKEKKRKIKREKSKERRGFAQTYWARALSIQEYYPQDLLDCNLVLLLIELQHKG
jgi:hypothetical protein